MSNSSNSSDDNIILSFADVKYILRKWKKTIWKGVLIGAALASAFALLRATKYHAEATFYEKSKDSAATKNAAMLLLGEEKENSAIVMLKSHKILEAAIKKLDLQATIEPYNFFGRTLTKAYKRLHYIKNNLVAQTAYLTFSPYPSVEDTISELAVKNVEYPGEIPLYFDIRFIAADRFIVNDSIRGLLGEGSLDEPFVNEHLRFTLSANQEQKILSYSGKRYWLTFEPSREMAENLSNDLKVVSDYKDKSYITLTLSFRSRQGTSELLNAIMDAYRDHLLQDHHQIVASQVAYLRERRKVVEAEMGTLMQEHATQISAHAGSLDVLVATQQNLQKKLLQIDLEMKHIQRALQEGSYLQAHYSPENEPPIVHQTIAEIRFCRQQCDSIDVALRNEQDNSPPVALEAQWQELSAIDECQVEAKKLNAEVLQDSSLPTSPRLENLPRYRIQNWISKLNSLRNAEDLEEYADFKSKFSSYLTQLVHHFDVQKKTLQDRLIYQQTPALEFQGIDLDSATALYISYCRELHELEANILQHQFIVERVQDPKFELSSLAAALSDAVSAEIVKKAGTLILAVKDQTNRTQRELERLGHDLELQRNFLTLHLQQIIELLKLRTDVLHSKIRSLQSVMFELLQKKISIQEKYLLDYTTSRLSSLRREQQLIQQQKHALQLEFDRLPEQWAAEKLVDLYLKSNKVVMENVGNLIETKNIADHLEMSLSAPFDLAHPPLHPTSPHIILFGILGAFLGAFSVAGVALGQAAIQGTQATRENLLLAGQYVVDEISDENFSSIGLESLRHLSSYLCPQEEQQTNAQMVLLLEGKAYPYGEKFAELLARRKLRVLVLDLCFDKGLIPEKNGLWQYLQGISKELPIVNKGGYSTIYSGGIYSYSCELLESIEFHKLLKQLLEQYDWIVAESRAPLFSAEAEILLSLFNRAAITVQNEKLQELKPYFGMNSHRIAFVVKDELFSL